MQDVYFKYRDKSNLPIEDFYNLILVGLCQRFKDFKSRTESKNIEPRVISFIYEVSQIIESIEKSISSDYRFYLENYSSETMYNFENNSFYLINDKDILFLYTDIEYRISEYDSSQCIHPLSRCTIYRAPEYMCDSCFLLENK